MSLSLSLVLFWCAVVWFGVLLLFLLGAALRVPGGGAARPLPWLVQATLIALSALARFLGY